MNKKQQTKKPVFNAKELERPGLAAEEIERFKEAYDLFDVDGVGYISVSELLKGMKKLGYEEKKNGVYRMVEEMDLDGNGKITFDEFLHMMTARISEKNSRKDMRRIYHLFDVQRKGHIDAADLKNMCHDVADEMLDDDIQQLLLKCDLDQDDRFTFEDFYNVMTKKQFS